MGRSTDRPHGDRQIIIGQKARSIVSTGSSSDEHLVNAYVQVGRAITLINPRYVAADDHPLLDVDQAITAATDALDHVFRP